MQDALYLILTGWTCACLGAMAHERVPPTWLVMAFAPGMLVSFVAPGIQGAIHQGAMTQGLVALFALGLGPRMPRLVVCAGMIAILASPMPFLPMASMVPAVATLVAWALATRTPFCPARLLDEALVLVALSGLLLAVVPDLVTGWRSAGQLQAVASSDMPRRDALITASCCTVLAVVAGMAWKMYTPTTKCGETAR